MRMGRWPLSALCNVSPGGSARWRYALLGTSSDWHAACCLPSASSMGMITGLVPKSSDYQDGYLHKLLAAMKMHTGTNLHIYLH